MNAYTAVTHYVQVEVCLYVYFINGLHFVCVVVWKLIEVNSDDPVGKGPYAHNVHVLYTYNMPLMYNNLHPAS